MTDFARLLQTWAGCCDPQFALVRQQGRSRPSGSPLHAQWAPQAPQTAQRRFMSGAICEFELNIASAGPAAGAPRNLGWPGCSQGSCWAACCLPATRTRSIRLLADGESGRAPSAGRRRQMAAIGEGAGGDGGHASIAIVCSRRRQRRPHCNTMQHLASWRCSPGSPGALRWLHMHCVPGTLRLRAHGAPAASLPPAAARQRQRSARPCRRLPPPKPDASPPCTAAGAEADALLRQYVQEALSAKASGGSTKLYDQ